MIYDDKDNKPAYMAVDFSAIPAALRSEKRWIYWKWTWGAKREMWSKPPYLVDGRFADVSHTGNFYELCSVESYREKGFDGVGIVFTESNGFLCFSCRMILVNLQLRGK